MAKTTSKSIKTYKKAKSVKAQLEKIIKSTEEQKELLTSVTGTVPIGGYLLSLNNIIGGSDTGQRVGRQIQGVRLDYKFIIQGPSNSALFDYIRVILFYDWQANATGTVFADVLDGSAGGNQVTWPKNTRSYPKRYTFLKDVIIPVQNQTAGGSCNADQDNQQQCGSIYLGKYPKTQFKDQTSSSCTQGHLIIGVMTYQNTGSVTTSAGLYGHFKYVYTDA